MDSKTVRYMLYAFIIIVCVVAIGVAVYLQFFKAVEEPSDANLNINGTTVQQAEKDQQTIKTEFNSLFTNSVDFTDYSNLEIQKSDNSKDIVYNGFEMKEAKQGQYDLDVALPMLNIDSEYAKKCNQTTQKVFADKINEILGSKDMNTICQIKYAAYINEDVLSLAIMANLKEGNNPQRVIVQTYNCNLKTGEEVSLLDVLEQRGIEENLVNRKIKAIVKEADTQAQALQESGYTIYRRDLDNEDLYKVAKTKTFMRGPQGELYIIYAYGNANFTSEMDIIYL